MNEANLRRDLVEMLEGGHARVKAGKALRNLRPATRSARVQADGPSIWELLEHLRIAQEDILRYTLDPGWKSPEFPEGYWPAGTSEVSDEQWEASVKGFLSDLEAVVNLVKRTDLDITSEIPHGEGRTYLREVLLVADHNSYHLGQIVQIRKAAGDWK